MRCCADAAVSRPISFLIAFAGLPGTATLADALGEAEPDGSRVGPGDEPVVGSAPAGVEDDEAADEAADEADDEDEVDAVGEGAGRANGTADRSTAS